MLRRGLPLLGRAPDARTSHPGRDMPGDDVHGGQGRRRDPLRLRRHGHPRDVPQAADRLRAGPQARTCRPFCLRTGGVVLPYRVRGREGDSIHPRCGQEDGGAHCPRAQGQGGGFRAGGRRCSCRQTRHCWSPSGWSRLSSGWASRSDRQGRWWMRWCRRTRTKTRPRCCARR